MELHESGGEQGEISLALAYKGKESTLTAEKGHIEQYLTAKSVSLTDNEHDTAMQLTVQAWYDIYSLLFLQTVCLFICLLPAYQAGHSEWQAEAN